MACCRESTCSKDEVVIVRRGIWSYLDLSVVAFRSLVLSITTALYRVFLS